MIYIDASAYLSALMLNDPNYEKAKKILAALINSKEELTTSYAILGEVLTVSTQRYDRQKGIRFVQEIFDGPTRIIYEDSVLVRIGFDIFRNIKKKNVGWVDCYSFAIIKHYKIEKVFSFDADFRKFSGAEVLQ